MSITMLRRIALAGICLGVLMVVAGKLWSDYSERSGAVVGANIGAGLLGLAGIGIAVIAAIIWVILLARRH